MTTVKKFRFRTIAVPFILMLVHALVISTVSDVYNALYPMISDLLKSFGLTGLPDYDDTFAMILTEYPRIAVFSSLLLIPLYGLILIFRRANNRNDLWIRRLTAGEIWSALAIATGLLGVTNLIFSSITQLATQYSAIDTALTEYLETAQAFSPDIGYGWLILGIAILAPISEELLFRGIIQGELRRAFPEWAAVLIQGILFALFHGQAVQIAYVIIPGLALGALYALTRSIWAPIVLHIGFNFLGSVVPAAVGQNESLLEIVALTEIAFIVVGSLAFLAIYFRRREV